MEGLEKTEILGSTEFYTYYTIKEAQKKYMIKVFKIKKGLHQKHRIH